MVYWKARGGTPFGLHPKISVPPVTPGMRLWLTLDQELVGGTDESGCYYRPEALAIVLGWYREQVELWLRSFVCFIGDRSEAMELARRILRCISQGRAEAQAEAFDEEV